MKNIISSVLLFLQFIAPVVVSANQEKVQSKIQAQDSAPKDTISAPELETSSLFS